MGRMAGHADRTLSRYSCICSGLCAICGSKYVTTPHAFLVRWFKREVMKYRYYICDVFTETRFGGNQLAVLPKADGLSDHQMQQITREFNFSESAFVFPAKAGHTRHVRIFTPAREIPFAGHPNVGTAFVLACAGEFGEIKSSIAVIFEEGAGLVSITIGESQGKVTSCELTAPQSLFLAKTIPV